MDEWNLIGRVGYLLGNILVPILANYGLIGRVWASQFIQDSALDLSSRASVLGCYGGAWVWNGAHRSFGLASGILGPFLYPHQLPPSPCVRTAWARAVIIPATVAISTCLLGYGLIKPARRHTWCVNDDPLGFALVFHTLLVFPYFLQTSSVLGSSYSIPSFFIFSVLVFRFLLDFHLSI